MAVLRIGSRGGDVKALQDLVNTLLKPNPQLVKDGVFGSRTEGAVRALQRKLNVPSTGIFDAATERAAQAAGASTKDQPKYQVTHKGKTYALTEREYQDAVKLVLAALKRGPVLEMRKRVSESRITWDHFKEINSDQYIVSWLIEKTRRVELPSESIVKNAEHAFATVESALESGELEALESALKQGEARINKSLDVMRKYRASMIKGGENWVTNLKFTKTAAFTAVGIMASPIAVQAGASVFVAGVISGAGTALAESVSGEIGKAAAGDKSQTFGTASWNVIRDTFLGGSVGAICKGGAGEKLTKGVAAKVAAKMAGKGWTQKTVARMVGKYLQGSFQATLEGAAVDTVKAMKNEKMTTEQFMENVARNLVTGGAFAKLDKLVENAGPEVTRLLPKRVLDVLSGVGKKRLSTKEVEKLVADAIKGPLSSPYSMALDSAVDGMRGKETPEQVGQVAAKKFINGPNLRKLEELARMKSFRR